MKFSFENIVRLVFVVLILAIMATNACTRQTAEAQPEPKYRITYFAGSNVYAFNTDHYELKDGGVEFKDSLGAWHLLFGNVAIKENK
jgi:uncharacterized FlgJ-related protein